MEASQVYKGKNCINCSTCPPLICIVPWKVVPKRKRVAHPPHLQPERYQCLCSLRKTLAHLESVLMHISAFDSSFVGLCDMKAKALSPRPPPSCHMCCNHLVTFLDHVMQLEQEAGRMDLLLVWIFQALDNDCGWFSPTWLCFVSIYSTSAST